MISDVATTLVCIHYNEAKRASNTIGAAHPLSAALHKGQQIVLPTVHCHEKGLGVILAQDKADWQVKKEAAAWQETVSCRIVDLCRSVASAVRHLDTKRVKVIPWTETYYCG